MMTWRAIKYHPNQLELPVVFVQDSIARVELVDLDLIPPIFYYKTAGGEGAYFRRPGINVCSYSRLAPSWPNLEKCNL